ncbi:ParA family protein [Paractinoplanes atraurantiacus]|uniref:Chromosome partitioning protein n=1 Tax=Paractinoplanes atraurantiacus TaxID=1036182 RepID=A0A285KJN5_9ACTN|nr:ParA family protein [Actinoplanes atraurantiacus]SNY72810.1 chromosome partitioning protein [Actinoplanes atraurantiacus]
MPVRVLLIMNEKGGVGKTTTAVGLAAVAATALAGRHKISQPAKLPVLLISADPQMSAYVWVKRSEEQSGNRHFDYLQVSDADELEKVITGEEGRDRRTIIIDSAGTMGFGAGDILSRALDLCTDVLVPLSPEGLSLEPTARTVLAVIDRGRPFRLCLTIFDPRDGAESPDLREVAAWVTQQGWPLCSTVVRKYKIIARSPIVGLTHVDLPTNRISMQARQDMEHLGLELNITGPYVAEIPA